MKKIKTSLLLLSVLFISSCNCSKEKINQNKSIKMASEKKIEPINATVPFQESVMLLGKANKTGLQNEPFGSWFNAGFENYKPDLTTVEKLKPLLKNIEISVFMGTWCEDSQREIPHFYAILEATGFDESKLNLIAVSEEKDTPEHYETGLQIEYVPTIIFYKEKKEIGRIVESSVETLEKDMFAIVSGAGYKHTYED